MNIYLVRHGAAENTAIGKKDFDRNLTKEGKSKIQKAASNWKNYIPNFNFIVTSPYLRAVSTANIIAEVFEYRADLVIDQKLSPGSKTEDLIEIANSFDGDNIVFVGHQPDLSRHLSNLISYKGANVNFGKGTIAKILFEKNVTLSRGILEFLIPADIFK